MAIAASACIMPTAADFEKGLDGPFNICPKPDVVVRVAMMPSQVGVDVGTTVRVEAALIGLEGVKVFCEPPRSWSSAAPEIASVVDGVVRGVAPGRTFVRAIAGGKTDSTAVTVTTAASGQ